MADPVIVGSKARRKDLIDRFVTRVIDVIHNKAQSNLAFGTGGSPLTGSPFFAAKTKVSPNELVATDSTGHYVDISALAYMFQAYAYNLTSLRRTQIQRIRTIPRANTRDIANSAIGTIPVNQTRSRSFTPTSTATASQVLDNVGLRITLLNPHYRMSAATFAARINSNPGFQKLKVGQAVTIADFDSFFNELAQIVTSNADNASVVNVVTCHSSAGTSPVDSGRTFSVSGYCCHSSCHGSCHGSRGRR